MKKITVSENLKKIYDEYHQAGISEWREVAAIDKIDHILAICQNIEHENVIEIGAGDGAILAGLDQVGFANQLYALEIAESAVEVIRSRNISSLIECGTFDGYSVPYGDKQFDIAIATHVLEHAEHPILLLKELKRVAKYIFIEVPLEYNFQGIMDSDQALKYGHINYYNPWLFSMLLKHAGLEIVESQICNSSLRIYKYLSGWKGLPKYLLKGAFLKLFPGLATKLFIYVQIVLSK